MTPRKEGFENILGIGENAGDQDFLYFQQSFQRQISSAWLKVVIVW